MPVCSPRLRPAFAVHIKAHRSPLGGGRSLMRTPHDCDDSVAQAPAPDGTKTWESIRPASTISATRGVRPASQDALLRRSRSSVGLQHPSSTAPTPCVTTLSGAAGSIRLLPLHPSVCQGSLHRGPMPDHYGVERHPRNPDHRVRPPQQGRDRARYEPNQQPARVEPHCVLGLGDNLRDPRRGRRQSPGADGGQPPGGRSMGQVGEARR